VTRARRLQPDLKLAPGNAAGIARICRLVEGMPLGILLAAAWVEVLTPGEIAVQIEQGLDVLEADWRDVPARQRSMRTVFGHSWQLLSGREREVMEAVSVFRGRFTWEAARQVAAASLRDLMALIHRSLLHHTADGRYELHELLRQFAAEKLCLSSTGDAAQYDEQGAAARGRECIAVPDRYCVALDERHCAAVRDRHCVYYAEFLHQREADVFKGYVQETMREIDNIRAGWDWAVRCGKAAEILKSSLSLWNVHNSMNWVREGATAFGRAADSLRGEHAGESTETREVALGLALGIQGFFSRYVGDAERAAQLAREGLSTLRKYGVRRELAMGQIFAVFGVPADDPERQQLLQESLAISQEIGFYKGTVLALRWLGRNEKALSMSRQANDRRGMAFALGHLGEDAYARQEYGEARQFFEESLTLSKEVGIQRYIGNHITNLGDVALALGEYEAARARYQEALAHSRHIRYDLGILSALDGLGRVALAVGNHVTAMRHYRQALEIAVETHFDPEVQDVTLRLDLMVGMAALLARTDGERAVELAALSRHHPSCTEEIRGRAQRLLDSLRARLSHVAFAAAEERGRSRDLEATVAELLTDLEEQNLGFL
jgi:tetratricopeptide (TPR) repeat protein